MLQPIPIATFQARRVLAAAALLLAGAAGSRAAGLPSGTVRTFDFDTGLPALAAGDATPFRQAVDGLEATFRDPAGARAFAVQSGATSPYLLPGFSGHFLVPARLAPGPLVIEFGQALRAVAFTFATADSHQAELATAIQLNAYHGARPVGVVQARGTYGTGTLPVGTLAFEAAGAPFDSVVVTVPPQPRGATACLVDKLVATVW